MAQVQDAFAHRVAVIEPVWVPMPDGTRLAAKLWLPQTALSGAVPGPGVLEYRRDPLRDGTRTRDQGLQMSGAGHGYACLRLSNRSPPAQGAQNRDPF